MTTEAIVRWILTNFEGAVYTDDPIDSGGATKHGITLRTWQYFLEHVRGERRRVTKEEIKNLTVEQAVQCISAMHVGEGHLDQVDDWRVRFVLVDWSIHSWYVAPTKAIQNTVGVPEDGQLGPQTLTAVTMNEPLRLVIGVVARRLEWMDRLIRRRPKDEKYRRGWTWRVVTGARFVSET